MEGNSATEPITVTAKKHIVVYGKHDYIVQNLQGLIEKADYTASGFSVLDETLDYLRMHPFDAIVIGGGVDPHDRIAIQQLVDADFQHAKVIEHYGGPATVIQELTAALSR
jgi:hypothetical protein